MTRKIFKIASAAIVLSQKETWECFHWNLTECSLAAAIETLGDHMADLTKVLEHAYALSDC